MSDYSKTMIIIEPDGTLRREQVRWDTVDERVQLAIDGFPETVVLHEQMVMYANESAIHMQKEPNAQATYVAKDLFKIPASRMHPDGIFGTVVLMGYNGTGSDVGLPHWFMEHFNDEHFADTVKG